VLIALGAPKVLMVCLKSACGYCLRNRGSTNDVQYAGWAPCLLVEQKDALANLQEEAFEKGDTAQISAANGRTCGKR